MSTPRVSVLLPVRDGEPFLAEAVESILAQTLGELELLVVDDGSRDGSGAWLEARARRDPRLRVLRQPARGLVAALNRGLAEARAELVARMDHDDVARPDRLARQAAFLERAPEVAVVGGAARVIDAAGRPHYRLSPPCTDAEIRARLTRENCLLHASVMLRAAAVRAAGGYRAAFLHAEDHDLWLRLAERHALANLAEPVLDQRLHEGQVSRVGALEQQVWSSLAAREAARRRRAGLDEGIPPGEPVTRARLAALGLAPQSIAAAESAAYAARAADLAEIGRPDLAAETLRRGAERAGPETRRGELAARYQLARARRARARGRPGRALVAGLRSLYAEPALAGAALGGWLSRAR